jgi:hypothetical protein
VATLAVCGANPNPFLFEETANALIDRAKDIATKYSLLSTRNVIKTGIDELKTLPLTAVNPPADAPIEIQLPIAADPPAISLTEAEIPSH